MNSVEARKIIVQECLKPGGFALSIRENQVEQQGYSRLLEAIELLAPEISSAGQVDRLVVACLFELPWEIENTVEHYSNQSPELGRTVARMADELRSIIHEMLWEGLESYYE